MIVVLALFIAALAVGVAARQRLTVGAAILGVAAIVSTTPPAQPHTITLDVTAGQIGAHS